MIPPEVPILYKIVLDILGFLCFHIKLSIVPLRSVKNCGALMRIALNLYTDFGKIVIFALFILPIQEHGRFFHFSISSSISFFKDLKFLLNRSFTSLVRVTPKIFYVICSYCEG